MLPSWILTLLPHRSLLESLAHAGCLSAPSCQTVCCGGLGVRMSVPAQEGRGGTAMVAPGQYIGPQSVQKVFGEPEERGGYKVLPAVA